MLTNIAIVATVAVGVAGIVRAAPWAQEWLSRKPLACPLCMAFHCAWVTGGLLSIFDVIAVPTVREAVVTVFGATGLATYMLVQTGLFAPPLDLGE